MQPKVSVVIAFLNGENFIGEALASVHAQTFADWELLLVNDGSSDASPAIARDAAARDPRIRCLEHPGGVNRGLALSRRLGREAARGELLLYLDHDDILYADCLQKLVDALAPHPAASAVFACTMFWAYDPALGGEDYTQTFKPLPNGPTDGRAFLRRLLRSENMHPAVCSTLFRRTALDQALDDFDEPFSGMYEDTAVLAKLLSHADVVLLNEPVSAYRMHGSSMCQVAKVDGTHSDETFSADRYRFMQWLRRAIRLDLPTRMALEYHLLEASNPTLYRAVAWYRGAIRQLRRRVRRTLGVQASGQ